MLYVLVAFYVPVEHYQKNRKAQEEKIKNKFL